MEMFECCHHCKPPKRTPTCKFDGTCDEYQKARAKYDELKAECDKRRKVSIGIYDQRSKRVYEAAKNRRKGKRYAQ